MLGSSFDSAAVRRRSHEGGENTVMGRWGDEDSPDLPIPLSPAPF